MDVFGDVAAFWILLFQMPAILLDDQWRNEGENGAT